MTRTAHIKTGSDSWVDEGHVGAHHGDAQILKLNNAANENRGLVHFALPFKKGATITQATLNVYIKGSGWSDGAVLTAKRITTKWREDRVTWHTKPDVTATHAGASLATTEPDGTLVTVDVTDILQDVADGSVRWQGFQLTVDKSGVHAIHSAESTTQGKRPSLDVEWTYLPDEPTDLSPTGDGVVNTNDPVFTWSRMTSTDKGAEQASVQFEMDSVDTFDSGDYFNSGWVTTTHPFLQGSDMPGWTNLGNNTDWFWRVKVRDDSGATSGWSHIASFSRKAWTDTLALTTPATDPDALEGTTPVFAWTFAPQTAFKAVIEIQRSGDNAWDALEHDHDNWTTDDLEGFDLEPGVIRKRDKTYRITVYVRDAEDRVATPGDPAWQKDSAVFTIQAGSSVDPVTKVVVTPDTDSPMTWVRWHRDIAPDSFVVFKDDEAVFDGLDPLIVAVNTWDTTRSYSVGDHVVHTFDPGGGPETHYYECISAADNTDGQPQTEPTLWDEDLDELNYEVRYWGQVPGDTNTYEVKANVDGVHSNGDDTTTRTLRADGLWLVAVNGSGSSIGTLVAFGELSGRTNRTLTIGETADVYNVIGRRAPVRVTAGIRGYEGTMSGTLGPLYGHTANHWRDNLQSLIGRNNQEEVRIIMQGLNVPVTLGDVSITPTAVANLYTVSIEVFQVGEFFDLGRAT